MNVPSDVTAGLGRLCADVRRMVGEAESGTPSINEMVETYYAVSNFVVAMNALGKDGAAADAGPPEYMLEVAELVSGRFDNVIHPRFKSEVSHMISSSVTRLRQPQSDRRGGTGAAREENAGDESAEYERLRSLMSVKEFIEQYDSALMRGRSGVDSAVGDDSGRNPDDGDGMGDAQPRQG